MQPLAMCLDNGHIWLQVLGMRREVLDFPILPVLTCKMLKDGLSVIVPKLNPHVQRQTTVKLSAAEEKQQAKATLFMSCLGMSRDDWMGRIRLFPLEESGPRFHPTSQ